MPNPKPIIGYPLEGQAEMNVLSIEKQIQIVTALVEGNSVRTTARMVGVGHKTVMRGLLRVGDHCARLLNDRIRRLPCKVVQMDEIRTSVGKKEKRVRFDENPELVRDQYLFVAMDSETKLIPSFRAGKRQCCEYLVLRLRLADSPCKPYPAN
jgi:hypothetical protein